MFTEEMSPIQQIALVAPVPQDNLDTTVVAASKPKPLPAKFAKFLQFGYFLLNQVDPNPDIFARLLLYESSDAQEAFVQSFLDQNKNINKDIRKAVSANKKANAPKKTRATKSNTTAADVHTDADADAAPKPKRGRAKKTQVVADSATPDIVAELVALANSSTPTTPTEPTTPVAAKAEKPANATATKANATKATATKPANATATKEPKAPKEPKAEKPANATAPKAAKEPKAEKPANATAPKAPKEPKAEKPAKEPKPAKEAKPAKPAKEPKPANATATKAAKKAKPVLVQEEVQQEQFLDNDQLVQAVIAAEEQLQKEKPE
jgi:hypothetical protein